jgi:hypothetical protein
MKKMILGLAFALSSLASFAKDENVSQKVLDAFHSSFATVSQVEWANGSNYYRASFVYNNKHVFAYYDLDGQLMGLTRYISSNDLPLCLQTSLKNDYSDYWISDLFEAAREDGTTYYITLENADTRIVLKSTGTLEWELYKKFRKV